MLSVIVKEPFYYPAGTALARGATVSLPDDVAIARVGDGRATWATPAPDVPGGLVPIMVQATPAEAAAMAVALPSLVSKDGISSNDLGSDEVVALRTLALKSGAIQGASPLIAHFPMNEGTGTTIREATNPGITGTVQGTTTNIWPGGPGDNFNGTNNQAVVTLNSGLLRQIGNLASMVPGRDQLTIALLLTHPTTLVAGALLWMGLSGDSVAGGWGLHQSLNWGQWRMRSPGSSAVKNTLLQAQARTGNLLGNGTANTRTALAFDIQRSAAVPGYLEIRCYKTSGGNRGKQAQNDWCFVTVPELHDGATGLPAFNGTAALTLGGQPQADQANFTGRIAAGYAMANLSLTRRAAPCHGLGGKVAQEMAANSAAGLHYTLPASLMEL